MPARTPYRSHEQRLGALDVLRLLAALSVVAFHFTASRNFAWDGVSAPAELAVVQPVTVYGTLDVPLFFVISGFVLLMSAWGNGVPGFVASRAGRLFPAYWVAVGVSIVLMFVAWPENPHFAGITAPEALLNVSMFQGAFGGPNLDRVTGRSGTSCGSTSSSRS
jgi:peptidoglycan/LPS O-acetylase OafA/YrhL